MRSTYWISIAYIFMALGIAGGLYFGFQNDHKIKREVYNRCLISEQSRAVFRKEHERKLVIVTRQLSQAEQFNDGRPLPPGFNQKDLDNSISNLQDEISLEEEILASLQPSQCKQP